MKNKNRDFKANEKKIQAAIPLEERQRAMDAVDPELTTEAERLLALLVDESTPLNMRLSRYLAPFDEDAMWLAGCKAGLLPALVALQRHHDLDDELKNPMDWAGSNVTVWILNSLLHGAVRGNGKFNSCNVSRVLQYMVETEGAWEATLEGYYYSIKRAIHPRLDDPQLRAMVNDSSRNISRTVVGYILPLRALGRPLTVKYAEITTTKLAKIVGIFRVQYTYSTEQVCLLSLFII